MVEVRVAKVGDGWLARLGIFGSVDGAQDTGVGQVADIVHHRAPGGLYLGGELGDIEHLQRWTLGKDEDELPELVQETLLKLLDEKEVYLEGHIERLEEVLRVEARL